MKAKPQKKEEKKRGPETITGGTRVPVVNSLAEIYERFARRITYEESIQKNLESNSDTISLEETLSSDSIDSDSELVYSPQIEEMDRDLLQGYQRTLEKLAQRIMTKDINISKFYGYDHDDIDQWLDEFYFQLEARDISPGSRTALMQLTI